MENSDCDEELVAKWRNEQRELSKRLIIEDTEPWQLARSVYDPSAHGDFDRAANQHLRYVAGLDISFVKDSNRACSGLFIFEVTSTANADDEMPLVYSDLDDDELIEMQHPYISGYLAYREAPFLLAKLERLRRLRPDLYPQCLLVDGNGFLHAHKFGLACHLGVLSDTPTIGVSKKLHQVFGLQNNATHKERIVRELKARGDCFELRSDASDDEAPGSLLGYCYRSTEHATNPIYVSIGHKMSWSTCLWLVGRLVKLCRIPEPIRQADLLTRDYLRKLQLS